MHAEVQTIDLRGVPCLERNNAVFGVWQRVKPGQILEIINDHDPRPFHYRFKACHHGKYKWQNSRKGAKKWIIHVKKLKNRAVNKKDNDAFLSKRSV